MLAKFFSWLGSLKLTLSQWGVVALSGALGLLGLLLRMRSAQLHKARVQLLEAQYNAEIRAAEAGLPGAEQRTAAAKRRLDEALKAYDASLRAE